ncbi:MAG: CcmD family protein [Thermodesulfobacteriota bacterium]|nr:CcmD family protein [Thermodesulfobacteriota bacterium]
MKNGLGFVAAVNLVIWAGIALYLFVLDRRLKKLEQMYEEQRTEDRGQRTEDRGQRSEVRG